MYSNLQNNNKKDPPGTCSKAMNLLESTFQKSGLYPIGMSENSDGAGVEIVNVRLFVPSPEGESIQQKIIGMLGFVASVSHSIKLIYHLTVRKNFKAV